MKRLLLSGVMVAVAIGSAGPAGAQVGHEPRKSPYRDIVKSKSLMFQTGYFGGSGGSLGVGPNSGQTVGGRFDLRLSNTFQFGFSFNRGDLERLIQNPDDSVAKRTSGPVPQTVSFFDIAAQLNLTGTKSWHRLAPYFSAVVGLAVGGTVAADTSDFNFGTRFYLAPTLGTRVILSQSFHLRVEARANFWKLKYPNSFTQEPALEPGIGQSNALRPDGSTSEWTISPFLMAGLGVSF